MKVILRFPRPATDPESIAAQVVTAQTALLGRSGDTFTDGELRGIATTFGQWRVDYDDDHIDIEVTHPTLATGFAFDDLEDEPSADAVAEVVAQIEAHTDLDTRSAEVRLIG